MFGKRIVNDKSNIIIKIYFDLEPEYNGDNKGNAIFNDLTEWNAAVGMLGMLKVELDTKTKTQKILYFKQILNPTSDDYINTLLGDDVDLIVSWNGRRFDNTLINNLLLKEGKKENINKIINYDRDLIDICQSKNISVAGGLAAIPKRLNINIDTIGKDVILDEFFDAWDIVFVDKNIGSSEYVKALNVVKARNKFDCEVLMLMEKKFDLLFVSRNKVDDFHRVWSTKRVKSVAEKERSQKIGEHMKKIRINKQH